MQIVNIFYLPAVMMDTWSSGTFDFQRNQCCHVWSIPIGCGT